jgi:iron(II)-dependent oxidoreductase
MFCIQRLKYVALFLLLALIMFGCGKDPDDPVFDNPNDPLNPNYKDDAPMVLIPAGEFQMGDSLDGMSNALPVHTVYLDTFYIDIYEVTNAQYKKFMDATGYQAPNYWNDSNYNAPKQPVVGIDWNDAKAYADWAGKRLPTEAEWEKSARGGLVGKRYPWGNDITHDNANYQGTGGKDVWNGASPVGSFAPNGYGLYDMAGNVWEWCADWYGSNYYASSPKSNPTGPGSGSYCVLRGGSWLLYDGNLRVSIRYNGVPTPTLDNVGFRCVSGISVTP